MVRFMIGFRAPVWPKQNETPNLVSVGHFSCFGKSGWSVCLLPTGLVAWPTCFCHCAAIAAFLGAQMPCLEAATRLLARKSVTASEHVPASQVIREWVVSPHPPTHTHHELKTKIANRFGFPAGSWWVRGSWLTRSHHFSASCPSLHQIDIYAVTKARQATHVQLPLC